MKVRIVLISGNERDFSSIKSLKQYCLLRTLDTPSYILRRISVFALDSGKRVPFRYGIKTLYDFIDYYRV